MAYRLSDAAGKGGIIKTITSPLNPRIASVHALGTPSDREKTQWYFQRYVKELPAAGEWVIFDRSWYNRAGVEKVSVISIKGQQSKAVTPWGTFASKPLPRRSRTFGGICSIEFISELTILSQADSDRNLLRTLT
jgi:hypothetical protein